MMAIPQTKPSSPTGLAVSMQPGQAGGNTGSILQKHEQYEDRRR